jgi:hypothetical protein
MALGDPAALSKDPEQQVAMMARYTLLDGLIERGILNEYMDDELQRKKLFAAAATLPCNKDDMGEAIAHRFLRDSPPDVVQKAYEEFRQAGYDPASRRLARSLGGGGVRYSHRRLS